MRYAAKVDEPHKSVVDALRRCGCQVISLAALGKGVPDLLVRLPRKGLSDLWLLEVKGHRGRLTEDQKRFHALWPEVLIVHSPEEALRALGLTR